MQETVGQKFNGNYKARLKNRLQNFDRANVPKFTDQAQVQSSINTGDNKKG